MSVGSKYSVKIDTGGQTDTVPIAILSPLANAVANQLLIVAVSLRTRSIQCVTNSAAIQMSSTRSLTRVIDKSARVGRASV